MTLLDAFLKTYETTEAKLVVKDRPFVFYLPKDVHQFVNDNDVFKDFPLWAKIWEGSLVLAEYLSTLPVEPGEEILEIGCGVGVVGIVAAAFGHRVVMTEANEDAISFARANAEANLPSDRSLPEIETLDWHHSPESRQFHRIIGSEITYSEKHIPSLLSFFEQVLKPEGEIILAEGLRKTSISFFRQMDARFHLKAQKKVLRSGGQETRIILCRMKFR